METPYSLLLFFVCFDSILGIMSHVLKTLSVVGYLCQVHKNVISKVQQYHCRWMSIVIY